MVEILLARSGTAAKAMHNNVGNSPASKAMESRRQLLTGQRAADKAQSRALSKMEAAQKRTAHKTEVDRKQDVARDNRTERARSRDSVLSRRDNRTTHLLLNNILDAVLRMNSGGGSMLGGFLGGFGLRGLLGGIAGLGRLGARGLGRITGGIGKLGSRVLRRAPKAMQDAKGQWRTADGRFAKAPKATLGSRVMKPIGKMGDMLGGLGKGVLGKGGSLVGKGGALLGKGGLKLVGAGARFLGPIGFAISAFSALNDGLVGMGKAEKILGREVSKSDRIGVGVSEAINGAMLGLPNLISKKLFGKDFTNLMFSGVDGVKEKLNQVVTDGIESVKTGIGEGIGTVFHTLGGVWYSFTNYVKSLQQAAAQVINGIKSMDMVAAASGIAALGKLLMKAATAPAAAVVGAGVAIGSKVGEIAVDTATAVKSGASYVAGKVHEGLGWVSSKFESRGGAGTVSSGKGDRGGASYGTYQLASKTGTLQAFLKSSGYDKQFTGLAPGSKEFNAKWKTLASTDPNFGAAQHNFIQKTHYDPQMRKLAKAGIDLTNRGQAVQEAVFSTSVQYGPGSSVITKALAGKNVAAMSDAQVVSAIQDYKLANNDRLMKSSSADVRAGVAKRIVNEKAVLLGAANNNNAAVSVAPTMQQATTPAPTVKGVERQAKLSEPLPEPKPQVTPTIDPATNTVVAAPTAQTTQAQATSTSGAKGNGGLPNVEDIFDRPLIEMQAIATTLAVR